MCILSISICTPNPLFLYLVEHCHMSRNLEMRPYLPMKKLHLLRKTRHLHREMWHYSDTFKYTMSSLKAYCGDSQVKVYETVSAEKLRKSMKLRCSISGRNTFSFSGDFAITFGFSFLAENCWKSWKNSQDISARNTTSKFHGFPKSFCRLY